MGWLSAVLLVLGFVVGPGGASAREDARIVAPSIDPEASCKVCHADVLAAREEAAEDDAHEDVECLECHRGRRFNPHLPPELDPAALALTQGLDGYWERSPDVIAGCADCHEDEIDEWRQSVHGAGPRTDDGLRRPNCDDCHGSAHAVTSASQAKRWMASRCIACHDFDPDEAGPASPYVVDTYTETVHGKSLALGNEDAAACADCHTGHEIYPKDDPRSTVFGDRRVETCRACHRNATASFSKAVSHRPPTLDADFWAWATTVFFAALTLGTIVLLVLHILLDLSRAAWNVFRHPSNPPADAPGGPLAADDEIRRFDGHERLQHGLLLVSFVILAVSGWFLKSAAVRVSGHAADALGGSETLAFVHRVAGALLLGVALYHLSLLAVRWGQGRLGAGLIPSWKDVRDLGENLLYFVGLRDERPKFGRFTYYEKFDYWAVFWGIAIMGGTGVVLWFPEIISRLLPGEVVALAYIAHSEEALLAILAIFLWHFYNVHLRPAVFPMSWVWITGRITAEAMYEEHRLEYERRYGKRPPARSKEPRSWLGSPAWSFGALLTVLAVAGGIVAADVQSVRKKIATLDVHSDPFALVEPVAAAPPFPSAYDDAFDPWTTCFDCHNEKRYETDEEHFPHRLHFEDEELDDDCAGCHESRFHRGIRTLRDGCTECHEPDEIGLDAAETG